jgi:hypothetical protein
MKSAGFVLIVVVALALAVPGSARAGTEGSVVWESGTCEARYECYPDLWVVCQGEESCLVGDGWVECDGWLNECPPPDPCSITVPCFGGGSISCSGQYYCYGEWWDWVNCDGVRKRCPAGPMDP